MRGETSPRLGESSAEGGFPSAGDWRTRRAVPVTMGDWRTRREERRGFCVLFATF